METICPGVFVTKRVLLLFETVFEIEFEAINLCYTFLQNAPLISNNM